jgi:predicted house-cleaning NTP pyrophosphatase (Maf/HAM1 superfamily)
VETISSIVVTNTGNSKIASGVDLAKIFYKQIPKEVIEVLITKGDIFTRAGGFIHDDSLIALYVDHLEGTRDSLDGLPLALLKKLIADVS